MVVLGDPTHVTEYTFFLLSQCVEDESRAIKFRKQCFSRHLLKPCMILLLKNVMHVNVILKALIYFPTPPPPRTFLKELEKCTENPELLAHCFLKRVSLCS